MRKIYISLGVAFSTLIIGLFGFFLLSFQVNISKIEDKVVHITRYANESKDYEDIDPFHLPEGFPPLEKGEFFNVGHACGNGYVDGYLAYDGSKMSAGLDIVTPKNFKKVIKEAEKIVEKTENFKNKDVKKGIRIVLQGRNKKNEKEFYEIIWYDRKEKMYYVVGPNLEITLELEKWLNSRK